LLLFAWKKGALVPWFDAVVQYNAYSYSPSIVQMSLQFWKTVKAWHWYALFSVVGAVLWWRRRIGRDVLGILACVLGTSLFSAYVRGKGFGYHLGAILPVFAIPIAACLVAAFEAWRERPTWSRAVAFIAAALIAVVGLEKKVEAALGDQVEWY